MTVLQAACVPRVCSGVGGSVHSTAPFLAPDVGTRARGQPRRMQQLKNSAALCRRHACRRTSTVDATWTLPKSTSTRRPGWRRKTPGYATAVRIFASCQHSGMDAAAVWASGQPTCAGPLGHLRIWFRRATAVLCCRLSALALSVAPFCLFFLMEGRGVRPTHRRSRLRWQSTTRRWPPPKLKMPTCSKACFDLAKGSRPCAVSAKLPPRPKHRLAVGSVAASHCCCPSPRGARHHSRGLRGWLAEPPCPVCPPSLLPRPTTSGRGRLRGGIRLIGSVMDSVQHSQ